MGGLLYTMAESLVRSIQHSQDFHVKKFNGGQLYMPDLRVYEAHHGEFRHLYGHLLKQEQSLHGET